MEKRQRICLMPLLHGLVPLAMRPIFFGANLVALTKKSGGIRPIAVGCIFRRLTSKVICFQFRNSISDFLQPTQFGFGVPLGCEAIAHAVRTYISSSHSNDHILVKLDFSNAFNSLRRDRMLEAVSKELPSAYNYIYSSYAQPSLLSYGDRVIASSGVIQQDDPLGPLLFSLTINTMVKSVQSELTCWYLDDGTLAGGCEDVQNDVNTVITEGSKLGLRLHINISKSEICCLGGATVPHPFFSNMPVLDKEHLSQQEYGSNNCWSRSKK